MNLVFAFNYTKLATLAIKAYVGEKYYLWWGLNLGPNDSGTSCVTHSGFPD